MTLFTELEVISIRHLVLQKASPDDAALSQISTRDPTHLRQLIRRHLLLLLDPFIPLSQVHVLFNQPHRLNIKPIPPRPLPPKIRAKSHVEQLPQIIPIPTLPRYETPPPGNQVARPDPRIGSLLAIIHPDLGSCVCRVIARSPVHHNFLIVCFPAELGPYWVPREYLFGFDSTAVLPIRDEEAFQQAITESDISVDWLLERILSAAQHLVASNSDLLSVLKQMFSNLNQVQHVMMNYVRCAALLIFCRLTSQWKIDQKKIAVIREAIEQVFTPKFLSTKKILAQADEALSVLSH